MPSEEHESMVAAFRAAGAVLTPTEPPSTDHLRAGDFRTGCGERQQSDGRAPVDHRP